MKLFFIFDGNRLEKGRDDIFRGIECSSYYYHPKSVRDKKIVKFKKKRKEIGGLRKEASENSFIGSSLLQENRRDVLQDDVSCDELNRTSDIDLVERNECGECNCEISGGERDGGKKNEGIRTRDDGKISVAWTVGNEKNGMELGASAIERIKRLESMITKRRGRRPMKLYDGDMIFPLSLLKQNNLSILTSSDTGSPVPGSAPSVMLPKHNPFDLPYDQHEEKPNLSGDAFQNELMESCPKDVQFCRHESFCFGGSLYGGSMHPQRRNRFTPFMISDQKEGNGCGHPKLKFNFGRVDCDEGFEQGTSSSHNNQKSHEVDSETEIDTSLIDGGDAFQLPSHAIDEDPKSPTSIAVVSAHMGSKTAADCSSSVSADVKYEADSVLRTDFFLSHMENRGHTPEDSIASDLQVEISEPGSPSQVDDIPTSTTEEETVDMSSLLTEEDCGLDLSGVCVSAVEEGHMGTPSRTSFMERCGYIASPKQSIVSSNGMGAYESSSGEDGGGLGSVGHGDQEKVEKNGGEVSNLLESEGDGRTRDTN